jgi:exocyst complex component 8
MYVLRLGKTKLSTTPPLAAKLTPLTASLTSALLGSLALPTNRKSTVVNLIALLLRLNAGPPARSTFLAARTEVMRKHIRAIRFEGDIGVYINDLAVVVFTGIKHTADWFLASFKENEVASCKSEPR